MSSEDVVKYTDHSRQVVHLHAERGTHIMGSIISLFVGFLIAIHGFEKFHTPSQTEEFKEQSIAMQVETYTQEQVQQQRQPPNGTGEITFTFTPDYERAESYATLKQDELQRQNAIDGGFRLGLASLFGLLALHCGRKSLKDHFALKALDPKTQTKLSKNPFTPMVCF